MRYAAQLLFVFLLSALVSVGIFTWLGTGPWKSRPIAVAPSGGAGTGDAKSRHATARQLVVTERLRQAQDEYLKILQDAPTDAEAFRGLVAVRRQLASEDATVLRRQAAAYRQLIARGRSGSEQYSRQSMERLASASLKAADAIDAERSQNAHRSPTATPGGRTGTATSKDSPKSVPRGPEVATRGTAPSTPATKPPASLGPSTPSVTVTSATSAPPAQPPQQPAPAQAPAAPGPFATPPASAPPPAAAPQSPPSAGSSETVAVVSPTSEPSVAQNQGELVSVNCQKRTFVLHEANGDTEYLAAPNITIYARGAKSERVSDMCALRGFIGRSTIAWSFPDGAKRIAKWVSVVLSGPTGGS